MADVLAVVSKAIFEKAARGLAPGSVWSTARYVSQNKGLAPLGDGGRLFLVTVRPPDEALWLVALLDQPRFDGTQWAAAPNELPIRDVSGLRSSIKFANGTGLPAKAGVLGMSLQTPRVLADGDVELLLGGSVATSALAPAPPKKKAARSLAALAAAAEQGDWKAALAGLLAIWRAAPNVALADEIVRIGARVAPDAEGVAKAWDKLAADPDPATIDALLATVRDKGSVKARPRLETMADWPADPRVDRWVAQQYAEPPLTSTGARPYWTRLQPLLAEISDATAIATIAKARKGYREIDAHQVFMKAHVDRAIDKLPVVAEVPVSAEDRALLARIAKAGEARPRASAKRADELLADVLANPADDGLRAVLADALQEAGDPRGELIALQLDPAESRDKTKRIAQIIKASRKQLLGPLDAALGADVGFTKGFLSHAPLKKQTSNAVENAIKRSVGHPLWATVEHLEGPGDWDVAVHPVMRSLRSIAASDHGVKELATWPTLEAVRDTLIDADDVAAVIAPGAFVALRRLDVTGYANMGHQIIASPLAARLDELTLRTRFNQSADESVALFARIPPRLRRFTLRIIRHDSEDWASVFELERGGDGRFAARVGITRMTKWGERLQAEIVRDDVIAGVRAIAALRPARLVLAPGFTVAAAKAAVEAVVREIGGEVEA
jgi:uncharacterized protein (TIGR02996 family)